MYNSVEQKNISVFNTFLSSFNARGFNFIGLMSGIASWIMAHIDSVATFAGIVITVGTGIIAMWSSVVKTNHQKKMNQLEYEKELLSLQVEKKKLEQIE